MSLVDINIRGSTQHMIVSRSGTSHITADLSREIKSQHHSATLLMQKRPSSSATFASYNHMRKLPFLLDAPTCSVWVQFITQCGHVLYISFRMYRAYFTKHAGVPI